MLRIASPRQHELCAGRFFSHLRSGQFSNFIFQPTDILALCLALCDGADAELTHVFGVIRPMIAYAARHFDVGGRIVTKQRLTRERPNVTLFFAGRDFPRDRRPFA